MRILMAMLLLLTAACNKPEAQDQTPPTPSVVEVQIIDFKFVPEKITIKAGTTIRWINKEKRQYHSVLFADLNAAESEYLFPDDSFKMTFNDKGTFDYRCGPHPRMLGSVTVE